MRGPLGSLGVAFIILGMLAAACGPSREEPDQIHVLTWGDIVNPVMARYVDRGIDTAERSAARAVVLRLDTPGGLDTSMRDIIRRIQTSEVPVIVYVAPSGGRAASAGTFVTMAGHIAAMAPNTDVPYTVSGQTVAADYNSWQEGKNGNEGNPTYAIITSRSYHPGVVMVALVDGSVRRIQDTIDLPVWRGLATRSGGEVVSPD